jgi:hypothetical protein
MSAVEFAVGKGLLFQLLGFRKAPQGDGINRFAEVLCESSISVEHAMAVIETFDYEFPTLREIRDTAYNLRPKFEVKADQKKQWEAKYGKPDPMFARRLLGAATVSHVQQRRAMLWQAIRDSIYYTETQMGRLDLSGIEDKDERINAFKFWKSAAVRNQRNHPAECQSFREELDRSDWDELMVYDWARGEFPPCALAPAAPAPTPVLANPITQADINRELERAGREPGDGE